MQFLADESCDFAVVRALRAAGYDVVAVSELEPGADDERVLSLASAQQRVLLTEDKDFGVLTYARQQSNSGVVLVRYPANVRRSVGAAVVRAVTELASRLVGGFVVVEPGRARVSRTPR